jgi:hypothetical protein
MIRAAEEDEDLQYGNEVRECKILSRWFHFPPAVSWLSEVARCSRQTWHVIAGVFRRCGQAQDDLDGCDFGRGRAQLHGV